MTTLPIRLPVMEPSPPATVDHQYVKGQGEHEHLGSMVVTRLPMRAPPTPAKKHRPRRRPPVEEGVDAHVLRAISSFPDGLEHVAEVAVDEPDDEEEGQQEPPVVPPEVRVVGNALDTQGAVGYGTEVREDHPDDLAKPRVAMPR